MRLALLVVAAVACRSSSPPPPAPAALDVHVDRRVELISIVWRLAGVPDYQTAPNTAYTQAVVKHFNPYASHPAVLAVRELRAKHGIGHDAPVTLAVHLDDRLQLRARPTDPRFTGVDLAPFLVQLRDFATASRFDAFFAEHAADYARVEDRLRSAIVTENPASWFDTFFGKRAGARFTVIPGMLNGNWNYGPHVGDELFQIIGVSRPDFDELPTIDAMTIELVVHEMAHSYVNPVFAKHRAALEPHGTRLYARVAEAMTQQAYGSWDIMMNEAGVRALTTLYLRERKGAAAADAAIEREVARSFTFTRALADKLATYAAHRERYADLDAFMPELVAFFAAIP